MRFLFASQEKVDYEEVERDLKEREDALAKEIEELKTVQKAIQYENDKKTLQMSKVDEQIAELKSTRHAADTSKKDAEQSLRDAAIKQQNLEERENSITKKEEELHTLHELLEDRATLIQEQENALEEMMVALREQRASLEAKSDAVSKLEASLKEKETSLDKRQSEIEDLEKSIEERKVDDDDEKEQEDHPTTDKPEGEDKQLSEKDMIASMILKELDQVVKDAEENEIGDEIEADALEALRFAAPKVCYRKKFYDVINDKFIYFPSVRRAMLNGSIFVEAEKKYFEDDDDDDEEQEFPIMYTSCLRSVASQQLEGTPENEQDEEYMSKLAMDME